jgi:acyl-CoA synthetase (AMP-forming)/AMP-acid ligase II
VTLEIRDENGRPAAPGVAGEIWAQGDNVMLGYWNDVDTTQSVLRDAWLKTGDMASMDAEGYIYIQGRRSDMIKTGAHRVAPNEIEEVIAEIDGVAEVAVVGVDDDILGQVIKAIVLPRPGANVDGMRVKAHCRDRLALYKIPKYVELVAELPKTASGKIQRFLLSNHSR